MRINLRPAVLTERDDASGGISLAPRAEKQLVEIPMVVGQYHLVSYTLNSLGVQREAGVPDFDG